MKHKKKYVRFFVCGLLLICLLLCSFLREPFESHAEEGAIYNTVIGKADILIKDEKGLKAFLESVDKGYTYSGVTVVLQNDITMSSSVSISSTSGTFAGVFDGNGKTISSFSVSTTNYASLFSNTTSDAVIKNLTVSAKTGGMTSNFAGGIVGKNAGQIRNCMFKGTKTGTNAAGICYTNTGTIKGCFVQDMSSIVGSGSFDAAANYCYMGTSDLDNALLKLTEYVVSLNDSSYYYWKKSGTSLEFSEEKYVAPTPAPDPTPTPTSAPTPAPVKEMNIQVDYAKEEILVTGPDELYFTVTTKETSGQKLPQKNWRRAYNADGVFCIDFSSLNPKKQNFIALTADSTVEGNKMQVQKVVKLVSTYKSVSFQLNYGQEKADAKGVDFLDSVQVVESDKSSKKVLDITDPEFHFEWKKGIMGEWKSMDELTLAKMESCRQTGATLYFRLSATENARASQIVAVRVKKQSAAPVLKSDAAKNTISLRNGVQFRVGEDGKWVTLNYYNKSGSDTLGYKIGDEYKIYDLKKKQECTSQKYNYLEIEQVKEYLKEAGITEDVLEAPNGFTIQVRNAPSLTKPASTIASYKIPQEVAALDIKNVRIALDDKGKKYLIEGLDATRKYEYVIVQSGVLSGSSLRVSETKWKKLSISATGKGQIKATDKGKYKLKGDAGKAFVEAKISDSGAKVILRLAGNSKKDFCWASKPSDPIGISVVSEAAISR